MFDTLQLAAGWFILFLADGKGRKVTIKMPSGSGGKILLACDHSEGSRWALARGIELAGALGYAITGAHVFNARMHEGAFRVMEPTLPPEYRGETILAEQRDFHHAMIYKGLEMISRSYLEPARRACAEDGIPFEPLVREGKNFEGLLAVAKEGAYDLILLGATGLVGRPAGLLGSVCQRVLRKTSHDVLVARGDGRLRGGRFLVGVDGSIPSLETLGTAWGLARALDAAVEAVYVYDPALHRQIFSSLKGILSREAERVFKTGEQEKMHDLFIDRGLLKVGEMILDRARESLGPDGKELLGTILEGPTALRLAEQASERGAALLFVGRLGRHAAPGLDLGSVAEDVARLAPCSVYVGQARDSALGWMS
jgi:nucleotide-binding universal stress UspA family protein